MRSHIIGAMRRHPGTESCEFFIPAVAALVGALMRGERLSELCTKASTSTCNVGGMLRH